MSGGFMASKSGWLRIVARVSAVMLLTFGGVWSSACSSDGKPAPTVKKCTLNSDCDSKLVCSFGLCHTQCQESKDCGLGQLCVKSDSTETGGVCQIEQESGCKFADDCPDPLVCGPDSQCRTPCRYPSPRDCLPKQVCARGGVCANPDEIDEDTGGIKGARPVDGGSGNPDPDGGDSCTPGGTCSLTDKPCKAGSYVCQGSTRVCQESGSQTDGTQCGLNQICTAGECVACVQDEACTPDETNPCKKGFIDCSAGKVCNPGNDADDGTECGKSQVCSRGSCVSCEVDEECQPDSNDPCTVGKMTCSAGPVCESAGNAENGTSCSSTNPSRICADGSCISCSSGSTCEPENVCHRGVTTCASGLACTDTGQNAANGKSCGSGNYCVEGECKACANGNPCVPTASPCKKGSTVCSGGNATCNATSTNADDGTECAANSACYAGVCTALDRTLTVKNPTALPSGPIEQQVATPVVIVLKDKNGVPVPNIPVVVTPGPGAFGVGTVTNAQGESSITVRLGRAVGAYQFSVSAIAVQAPATFSISATAPVDKTIYSIVNADHTSGVTGVPGSGAVARIQAPSALAAASDGTLYIGDQCSVYKLTPAGLLTVFAGKPGNCSQTLADGGQATDARLYYVRGLALDETNNQLYILDNVNNRVRVVDLTSNVIGTFIGGGSATTAPFGVPGPAGNVVLSGATGIALSPTGDLYTFDTNHARILKTNVQTGATTQFATSTGAVCAAGGPVTLQSVTDGSSIAWDAAGRMFLSAYFCNVGVPNNVYGVVRVESDGSFTHVAGSNSTLGSKSDGVPAQNAYFVGPPRIAFDGVGNLYVSIKSDNVVRRIDAATYRISTVAGGTATSYGDYGQATAAQLGGPEDIIFDAQSNLHIIDATNDSVRTVWKVGSTAASSYAFTIAGGTGQNAVPVDSVFDTLSVKLVDGANANVLNVPVRWSRTDLGSSLAATIVPTNAIAAISANNGRVGLLPGPYRFDATYSDLHGNATTRTFTVTAVAPAAGTIFTPVNTSMVSANTGVPGPGTVAQIANSTFDAVAASDGTLYLANFCSIEKLTPAGEISRFAGVPSNCAQAQGDGGPAIDARFYNPRGLALDETNKLLYVADTGFGRIRVIDLQTNIVNALAGGGTATALPWGDGPSGSTAVFSGANNLTLGSGGKLYVLDSNHARIAAIDVNTTGVSTFIAPGTGPCAAATAHLSGIDALSDIVWLPTGEAYISGRICGSSSGNGNSTAQPFGIVKRAVDGSYTHIAGLNSTGATSDGLDANKAYFPSLGGMALDSAGNIYMAIPSLNKVRKITIATGKITTVAGTGTSTGTGPAADYIAATLSTLQAPAAVTVVKGGTANPGDHLIIADTSNYAYREVW